MASLLTLPLFHPLPAHHGPPWLLVDPGASDHSAALPPGPQWAGNKNKNIDKLVEQLTCHFHSAVDGLEDHFHSAVDGLEDHFHSAVDGLGDHFHSAVDGLGELLFGGITYSMTAPHTFLK